MPEPPALQIQVWKPQPGGARHDIEELGALLHECVQAGASVSFILPYSQSDAEAFWREQVLPAVQAGKRRVLLACEAGRIVGTVQLDLDTPPNQPHRAEVKKLLVHPGTRRRGIARALMQAVDQQAWEAKRTLLTLDTVTGSVAERFYLSLGYVVAGVIRGYALNYDSSRIEDATLMYKQVNSMEGDERH